MIYIKDNKPTKGLKKNNLSENIETFFIELNFWKCKWLLCTTYRPPSQNHKYLFDNIDKDVDVYSTNETIALTGDFNAWVAEKLFDAF